MPKIEVNEKLFFTLLGKKYDYTELESRLENAKAELDEKPDSAAEENERVIKIELNDTNRPDLWSTAGVARALRLHEGAKPRDYSSFLSSKNDSRDFGSRVVHVDPELQNVRPFMSAFVISGKPIDEPMLLDIIQTQEKLCWNYGRKRRSVSMGIYRSDLITWPVQYMAADPDKTAFVPLAYEEKMTCRQIVTEHPKGKEYGWILKDAKKFPILVDSKDEILSMAPIINSATLGAVKVGDSDLLVEMTGTDIEPLLLTSLIVACDFADAGYKILPVQVNHPYDTGYGKSIVTPFYFQPETKASLSSINKLLGSSMDAKDAARFLERMGVASHLEADEKTLVVTPPPYRNDFLHEVDVIEDIMMGSTLSSFPPEKPHDFTIGRLLPVTLFSRKVKMLMVGLGYQEMIFNYLGSKKNYIDRMNIDSSMVIEISNPMSENYQFVRSSIIPGLLDAESVSANAAYPHKVFETGKTAWLCSEENSGTRTRQCLGFLAASADTNYNTAASEVATLLHFLGKEYLVEQSSDPRFIPGRQAAVLVKKNGKTVPAGIFGELHPQVLENWAISVPCAACELDLEELM